ncbi:surface antigen family protein [Ehrlichia chaffeensis str. Heartland]|uniref:28kDa outer membrane protein gene 14 n=1 Tax=Ehrlichia chaffeensis TaxID=945 RepID=Q8G8D6_EHRCH|nr:P44/Msp2 family outer membrane protein [Ehrlichia chaffeensis]AAO12939.1 28kDa outer membrane protein gene 14 [Ehrlichia chaffeensis]AAO12944.1 28kDa outer membrane protein gene 14 [Ehrlichia chaffeensis]AAO12954.1 28kDa outer membrane protein gene 14 [Ehrlichia chaffeensis]AHX03225.1 surface antigen family protein [Ehrlichia chaffeensis str. Heartland]AHX08092.1 surface antigen family protein [Ehrlichia chaffeensis str. Saint Vincent]
MNYKKIFVRSALISLMSILPYQSFADPVTSNDTGINDSKEGFYISVKYNPSISHFRKFSAEETPINGTTALTKKVFGLKKDGDIAQHGNFDRTDPALEFQNNLISGFSGSIGYAMDGPRIELEAAYQKFDAKNPDNNDTNSGDYYKYFGLSREDAIADKKYVVLKNEGITFMSLMVNTCYDITAEGVPFIPYACAGIGADLINVFKDLNLKFSYQGKIGISYPITPEVSAFIGGYYHGVIGNNFNKIPVITPVVLEGAPQTTSALVTIDTGYFGGEVGIRFTF